MTATVVNAEVLTRPGLRGELRTEGTDFRLGGAGDFPLVVPTEGDAGVPSPLVPPPPPPSSPSPSPPPIPSSSPRPSPATALPTTAAAPLPGSRSGSRSRPPSPCPDPWSTSPSSAVNSKGPPLAFGEGDARGVVLRAGVLPRVGVPLALRPKDTLLPTEARATLGDWPLPAPALRGREGVDRAPPMTPAPALGLPCTTAAPGWGAGRAGDAAAAATFALRSRGRRTGAATSPCPSSSSSQNSSRSWNPSAPLPA